MGLTSQMVLLNAVHWNLQVDTLLPDNVIGPRLAVNYLAERGHRAILHATELKRSTIKSRFASYQAALQEAGISIIGYDDIDTAPFIVPPLTTIRIDRVALGRLAVQRLIERRDHHDLTPVRVELFSQLIERQSVAPPNEASMAD